MNTNAVSNKNSSTYTKITEKIENDQITLYWENNVLFSINRPARDVWAHMKDMGSWQKSAGYYISGVVGDSEGEILILGPEPNPKEGDAYRVSKIIPEHLIIMELIPSIAHHNGVEIEVRGNNVFTLNEYDGKTTVTGYMGKTAQSLECSKDKLFEIFEDLSVRAKNNWDNNFIPDLTELVEAGDIQ